MTENILAILVVLLGTASFFSPVARRRFYDFAVGCVLLVALLPVSPPIGLAVFVFFTMFALAMHRAQTRPTANGSYLRGKHLVPKVVSVAAGVVLFVSVTLTVMSGDPSKIPATIAGGEEYNFVIFLFLSGLYLKRRVLSKN